MKGTIEVKLSETPEEAHSIADELIYSSYRYNRQRSPNITPAQWGLAFPNIEALETRYQAELKAEA